MLKNTFLVLSVLLASLAMKTGNWCGGSRQATSKIGECDLLLIARKGKGIWKNNPHRSKHLQQHHHKKVLAAGLRRV